MGPWDLQDLQVQAYLVVSAPGSLPGSSPLPVWLPSPPQLLHILRALFPGRLVLPFTYLTVFDLLCLSLSSLKCT